MIFKHLLVSASFIFSLVLFSGVSAYGRAPAVIHPAIEALFATSLIIDGNLGMGYRGLQKKSPRDLRKITRDTGVNIFSTGANKKLSDQSSRLIRFDSKSSVRVIRTFNDIAVARRKNVPGVIFYIQKPYAIPAAVSAKHQVQLWFLSGLRIIQLAYNAGDNARLSRPYAGGADEDDRDPPLTDLGRQVVNAMLDKYMVLDVSHVGKNSSLEIIKMAKARGRPVIANHVNARAVYNRSRNKDDDELCKIAQTGGVIGVNPIGIYVSPKSDRGTDRFIDHINHIVRKVAKNVNCRDAKGRRIRMINHVGVAADSGVDGWESDSQFNFNAEMQSVKRWKILASRLHTQHGYSLKDIKKIFGGNFLRAYKRALPGLRTFKLVSPRNNARIKVSRLTAKVRFRWKAARRQNTKAPTYTVNLQVKVLGKWIPARKKTTRNLSAQVRLLSKGLVYRWYVRARNKSGVSVNSRWRRFRVSR